MIDYNKNYLKAYELLNGKQKEAVHKIDGPVMVVAGPGTGKTQLLAARIGYILQNTDAKAHNILCLTFTDAGVIAMRKRLLSFIGPEAYNVNIYTYHSFCNMVIQDNLEQFGNYLELTKISDLERVDAFQELIDGFDNKHPLKKFKGDVYRGWEKYSKLFKTMKAEDWNAEQIEKAVVDLREKLLDDPDYKYKRAYTDRKTGKKYVKGDAKESKINSEVESFSNLVACANEFENFEKIMEKTMRYDYEDMILWVLDKFTNNNDLLLKYQERYEFFLVDEYQDTNGSQNKLIYQLANYWEQPNLFVVGDDDQSIFRFQGANMSNIVDFKNKFSPTIIILENNYRSGQGILDKSTQLIGNNKERLVNEDEGIEKHLIESRAKKDPSIITISKYHNEVHEEKAIINEIVKLKDQGYALNKVAVIYRKHRNVENIIKYLEINDVPLNVKRKINILEMPSVQQLISVMDYISKETEKSYSADYKLFEILHFKYFEITPREIAKISNKLDEDRKRVFSHNRTKAEEEPKMFEKRWRDVLADKTWLEKNGISEVEEIQKFAQHIESWIKAASNHTIQVLLEKILTDSTMLDDILSGPNSTFMLQVVNTFFEFLKSEMTIKPKLKLKEFISIIEKMEQNRLTISFERIIHANDGVNFITAHSAKGLEFEKVYIIRCEQDNWVDKRNYNFEYKYPTTLVEASDKSDVEDDRRLFFVAMTRAKDELHISYPAANVNGKEKERSVFIEEIRDENLDIKEFSLADEEIIKYKAELLRFRQGKVKLIDNDLIDKVLENYVMSVTNLNKYIKCPVSFYYEVILRVPQARSPYLGYGNAIHGTLHQLFLDIESAPERLVPPFNIVLEKFQKAMEKFRQHFTEKEFDSHLELGKEVLKSYYDANEASWSTPRKYELEYKVRNVEHQGVPIKGDIDKIVYHDDHFFVVDYKTGKWKSDKFRVPVDGKTAGDYWRQIIFYKLLIDADPHFTSTMKYGLIDFVEPQKGMYKSEKIEVSTFDYDFVTEEIKNTYKAIHNHEFTQGCEEETCRWCNFVADHLNAD